MLLQLVLAAAVAADPPPKVLDKAEHGPAPRFSIARIADDMLVLKETVMVPIPKKVTEEVTVDGKKVTREKTVTEMTTRTIEFKMALKDVKGYSGAGKKLEAKALAERLKDDTPVLVSMGEEVDPFYLKVVKDSATILVLPRPKLPPPPPPPGKDLPKPPPPPDPIKKT